MSVPAGAVTAPAGTLRSPHLLLALLLAVAVPVFSDPPRWPGPLPEGERSGIPTDRSPAGSGAAPAGMAEEDGGPDRGGASHRPKEGWTARQRLLLGDPVDPNGATVDEIDSLPGVSRRVAEGWVRTRAARGSPFRRAEDLLAVPGIKSKRLAKLLPFLRPFGDNN